MGDDDQQVSHLVPQDTYEDAKDNAEHGELSEAVREAYRMVAYGGDDTDVERLKMEKRQAESKRDHLQERREQLASEIAEVEDRIASLEERIETAETVDEKYDAKLQELEDSIDDGFRVFEGHAGVKEAARISGQEPSDVISDLRDRNPSYPDHAFEPKAESEYVWDGANP